MWYKTNVERSIVRRNDMTTDNNNTKSYEIWWYDELTDNWLLIYSSIDTYEQAIYLIDSRFDDSIDDKFRIYEKSISISKKLLKEI